MKNSITKALCLLCAGALVLGAAGCSKSDASSSSASSTAESVFGSAADYDYENFTYSDGLDENGYWEGVKALDYVTLPEDFETVTFKRSDLEPTEEDIQSQIDNLLSQNTTQQQVTDRAAADGDTVNIDYTGTVDGVAFTGGTYSGYSLTLGSGSFIDGFEDQIVGHTPGETFDVNVTFPDGYSDSTDADGNTVVLSGQKAVFSVTLNYISEDVLPELTDSWVDENYGDSDGVHSVEELQTYFQNSLYNSNLQNAMMDYLLSHSTFKDLPKEITDYQVKQCLNYYYRMASYYGYDLDSFLQAAAGYDNADALLDDMADDINTYAKQALIYQAVAETLDIVPTQEQIDTYSAYTDTYGANYCTMVALMDAVSDTLTENAVVVPENGTDAENNSGFSGGGRSSDATTTSTNGVTPELKEFLDSYEAYMDKYIAFMQSYDGSANELAAYLDMMQGYTDFTQKASQYNTDEMSDADSVYYLEVTTRVTQKLYAASLQ